MRERAIKFGRATSLAGVLAEPTQASEAAGRPAIVLLNSGILHHAGASRLHVQLARRLADEGFLLLRFDFSGIGDSEARRDTLAFAESAVAETREAMDWLTEKRGATSFVLAGLCSGADMAFNVAAVDERVVGVVQLDAYAYRTRGYWIRHYLPKLWRLSTWTGWIMRKVASLRPASAPTGPVRDEANTEVPQYRRTFPPRDQVAATLRALMEREVKMYFIFSGGQPDHINHREQYETSFADVDFGGRIRVDYLPDADHIFTGLAHQRHVVNESAVWLRAHWPAMLAGGDVAQAPARRLAVGVGGS